MRRFWTPCRVCEKEHTNPMSSSICPSCGQVERSAREDAERREQVTPFGQFMRLSDNDKWQTVFDRLNALESKS